MLEINIYTQKVKHSTMKEYRRKCVLQEIGVVEREVNARI